MDSTAHIDNTRLKPNLGRDKDDLSDAKVKLKEVQKEAKLDGEDEGYLTGEDVERVFELYEKYSQIHSSCTVYVAAEDADRLTELTYNGGRVTVSRENLAGRHRQRKTGFYVDFDFKKAEDEEAYEQIKELGFSSSAKRKYLDEAAGANDYPHDEEEIEEIREERKRKREREERERQRRIEQRQFESAEYVAKLTGLHDKYRFDRTFLDKKEGGYSVNDDSIYEVKHEEGNRTYLLEGEEVTDDEIEAHFEQQDEEPDTVTVTKIVTETETQERYALSGLEHFDERYERVRDIYNRERKRMRGEFDVKVPVTLTGNDRDLVATIKEVSGEFRLMFWFEDRAGVLAKYLVPHADEEVISEEATKQEFEREVKVEREVEVKECAHPSCSRPSRMSSASGPACKKHYNQQF